MAVSQKQRRNLLILKGSIAPEEILDLIHKLLEEASKKSDLGYIPKPWQVFSLICASGDQSPLAVLLSRGQKSTEECREIIGLIRRNSSCLYSVPSHWDAYFDARMLEKDLNERFDEPHLVKNRSEVFVWSYLRDDEPTNLITSYNYDITKRDTPGPSVSELFFQTLSARELPDDIQKTIQYPFYSLVKSAETAKTYHNSLICISFRDSARDTRENESESMALQNIDVEFHYPFVFSKSEGYTVPNEGNNIMLEAAAEKLARWLEECFEKKLEVVTVSSSNEENVDMV
ncbi:hypothetical protein ACJQWK_02963 [Exserohilum turcicum]